MEIRDDLVAKALLQDTIKVYTPRWDSQKMKTVFFLEESGVLTYAFYYYLDVDKYIPMTESELMMLREVYMTTTEISIFGKAIELKEEYYKHI